MTKDQRMLMLALSSICHYQEFIDTKEPTDLFAAQHILADRDLKQWITNNKVLLPLRRDGKTLHEAMISNATHRK